LVLTGSDKVAKDGNSFKEPFEIKLYDVDENLLADVPGATVAERLSIQ
jgi:hypothetical protein